MTERLNTTDANGETGTFAVAAGTVIQVAGATGSKAVVELQGRIENAAPWASIGSIAIASQTFLVIDVALAEAKLVWTTNKAGDALKAWSV
ncbi:hypothetical protein AB4Z13_14325 [Rhizobium sp. YAF28]|uniref:hypothetical protein n=1 Tax=Rhizobium sp. YAF28 TaxID=3233081 RepID=UPI003F9983DE